MQRRENGFSVVFASGLFIAVVVGAVILLGAAETPGV